MIQNLTLNNGITIPQLGFGTWLVDASQATEVVGQALEAGYRHIDTAQGYRNEAEIGKALEASDISREDLFITSKLNNNNHKTEDVFSSFDKTLADLQTDYLDLFLIHWPLPMHYGGDFVSPWKAMIELLNAGRVRAIGVSNFEPEHLDRIIDATGVVPAVNQIEAHPYFPNDPARAWCREHGIAIEAWGPLAQGEILDDPIAREVGARYGKTGAQAVLRWHIQRGDIIFPKSVNPDRMQQNLAIFDFELSTEDMVKIDSLDKGEAGRVGPHPNEFDSI